MAVLLEDHMPVVKYNGLNTAKDVSITGALTTTGTTTLTAPAIGAATGTSVVLTGTATAKSATAVPATAGAVAAGVPISMNSNGITIECTTDVPTHNRPIGSLCINLGGNSSSTRLYVASSAAGAWVAITTAS